jgi:hypothetical protein
MEPGAVTALGTRRELLVDDAYAESADGIHFHRPDLFAFRFA